MVFLGHLPEFIHDLMCKAFAVGTNKLNLRRKSEEIHNFPVVIYKEGIDTIFSLLKEHGTDRQRFDSVCVRYNLF